METDKNRERSGNDGRLLHEGSPLYRKGLSVNRTRARKILNAEDLKNPLDKTSNRYDRQ